MSSVECGKHSPALPSLHTSPASRAASCSSNNNSALSPLDSIPTRSSDEWDCENGNGALWLSGLVSGVRVGCRRHSFSLASLVWVEMFDIDLLGLAGRQPGKSVGRGVQWQKTGLGWQQQLGIKTNLLQSSSKHSSRLYLVSASKSLLFMSRAAPVQCDPE